VLGGAVHLLGGCNQAAKASRTPPPTHRKLIIVVFGGGTRSSEAVDDPEHRHIPRLWSEMVPRGTLFTNMRVEHRVVHPNSTGSILTGHWEVMAVAYGEIDCAHYGSWSRYVEAIRRTDELTWRLWRATEELDAYRGQTLFLILPDHGRELERPVGSGFIHHSDFYTDEGADEGCRRVWMLALGPRVRAGRRIERPIPITAAAGTGLEYLGLGASAGTAESVLRLAI
jgi:hypothetical protein